MIQIIHMTIQKHWARKKLLATRQSKVCHQVVADTWGLEIFPICTARHSFLHLFLR